MERLLSLGDVRALDPAAAGDKAAALARAGSAGLPVLPGWVLPVEHGVAALRAGLRALERSGPPAARLAIADRPLEGPVRRDLEGLARRLGGGAIVRSSVAGEADPRWAGAYASYHDVAPGDLAAAVRGCWASAFGRDALARCEAIGLEPARLRMAVLIQPWVSFDGGGIASVDGQGRVRVAAATRDPSALVAGRTAGTVAELDRHGTPDGDRELGGLGSSVLIAVASLVLESERVTGDPAIEWGSVDGRVVLLQVKKLAAPRAGSDPDRARSRRPLPAAAERLAELAVRCPGPLGDRLVLPWAMALARIPATAPVPVADVRAAFAAAAELAGVLTARAWDMPRPTAEREAADTLRSVLGLDPGPGLSRLRELRPVDPADAARLLALIHGIGKELTERGVLASVEQVWRLTVEELASAVEPGGRLPPDRRGPGRWDPFVFEVARTRGHAYEGAAVAPGVGAGRLRLLDGPEAVRRPGAREVLAVGDPVPQVAALLWSSAGLVTRGGAIGAHLFEVARSLGVPAVAGVDLRGRTAGSLVAVDGDAGVVSVLVPEEGVGVAEELGA